MKDFIQYSATAVGGTLINALWEVLPIWGVMLLLSGAERLRPAQPHQPWRDVIFNLTWVPVFLCIRSLIWLVAGSLGIHNIAAFLRATLGGPFLVFSFPDTWWGKAVHVVVYLVIFDFFFYWFHRLAHMVPALWPIHKIHHSDRSLNVTTTYRIHFVQDFMWFVLGTIPMLVIFDIKQLLTAAYIYIAVQYFIHMNLRVEFGWIGRVICTPQMHRVHHSILPEHQDKNFAAVFPFWDMIFKSYWHPRPDEFPDTGLSSGENTSGIWDGIWQPFRDWVRWKASPAASRPYTSP